MERKKLNNLPELKTFRRQLRNSLTPAEAKLWDYLKDRKLEGRKFRRQHSVGPFILDFYCPLEHLAIELDGQVHLSISAREYDRERDIFLAHFGIMVLRFENKAVFEYPDYVKKCIKEHFGWTETKSSPPFQGGVPRRGEGVERCTINDLKKQPPRPSGTPPLKGGELK